MTISQKMKKSTNMKKQVKSPGTMYCRSFPPSHHHGQIHSQPEAEEGVEFRRLGLETSQGSESEQDDQKERQAEQINVAEKDWGGVGRLSKVLKAFRPKAMGIKPTELMTSNRLSTKDRIVQVQQVHIMEDHITSCGIKPNDATQICMREYVHQNTPCDESN